jgi:hypothetical protein
MKRNLPLAAGGLAVAMLLGARGTRAAARRRSLLLIFLALGSTASAETVIGNFPPTNDSALTCVANIYSSCSTAAGFTMPAGSALRLDSVTLRLDIQADPIETELTVRLFGDESGPTGSPLLTLNSPSFAFGEGNFVFTPGVPFTLEPSTTYWIVARGGTIGTIFEDPYVAWLASNPGIAPSGLATSAGYRADASGVYPPTTPSSVLNTYLVEGTPVGPAVPALGPLALGALATLLLAITLVLQHRARAT